MSNSALPMGTASAQAEWSENLRAKMQTGVQSLDSKHCEFQWVRSKLENTGIVLGREKLYRMASSGTAHVTVFKADAITDTCSSSMQSLYSLPNTLFYCSPVTPPLLLYYFSSALLILIKKFF